MSISSRPTPLCQLFEPCHVTAHHHFFTYTYNELLALTRVFSSKRYFTCPSACGVFIGADKLSEDARAVQRQAFAGLLWSKQYYNYDVNVWLEGDPARPELTSPRTFGRNSEWQHLNNADVISMPDTWEYPWYAAWDLAFHCVPLAQVDPHFAKQQLILLLREWYMHVRLCGLRQTWCMQLRRSRDAMTCALTRSPGLRDCGRMGCHANHI